MSKIYYVYTHTRTDTNEVFYVGIGTKNLKAKYHCKIYNRSYMKAVSKRTEFWYNIYCKCNKKIIINIIFESSNIEDVKQKEIALIKFYGRSDLNLGFLCNLTDGGDGIHGYQWSEEQKKKRSSLYKEKNPFKGKQHTQEVKDFLKEINFGKNQGEDNPMYGKTHTIESKNKIAQNGKIRAINNELPILKPQIGKDNYFAKKFIAINPHSENEYLIHGNIKKFLNEFNLSYSLFKNFLNKGKCLLIDKGRAREKAKNTVDWIFKTYNDTTNTNYILYT